MGYLLCIILDDDDAFIARLKAMGQFVLYLDVMYNVKLWCFISAWAFEFINDFKIRGNV